MSGGVDSSVTALLLQQQGLRVEGVFMRNWDTRDERGECPSERDWRDVQRVCRQLDIKCHEVNLVKEYWNSVFSVALDEYQHGRTPNPDVLCNKEIKFGVLLREIARRLGDAWFATGHYARAVRKGSGEMALLRGVDERKDQSYYLSAVSSQQLDRVLFPLGGLRKAEDVRPLAQQAGLATAQKEESMGICFVGERRRFDEFLGDIVSSEGKKLGTHSGLFTKTIGQSAGISGWQEKWYVYAKDIANNRMYAAQNSGEMHGLEAQIRYMQKPQRCSVLNGSSKLTVTFDNPQFGVAAGQYLVLYRGEECLGSAVIQQTMQVRNLPE
ncbi:5-methylaminomethyl-2-thiouridylate-methyltransferase [Linderina pennispora]|uniref:tRNA-5-taurinomethyluridine 2-sulfurtransferase n=1 Tax=Linderina pennispora TaxID=61395 RepID=A0A1Y1WGN6_9FUNG|nr:5-methylaminomethyl-2-thiouridylate-methyltransferase [Linderina pennispora]ORX72294.1 5-methylaminomethyl-2-thiouridylate-methyltransferase [Linderina pennispora]